MNINDMTIGQAKELAELFRSSGSPDKSNIYSAFVGKYVICRSRNEGVNAGFVEALDETGVVLKDARRLYYHKPLSENTSWYEGVAESGLSSDSKISSPSTKLIAEEYSLTLCTNEAKDSIINMKSHEQN